MALRYFNKQGQEITSVEWRYLSRIPAYCIVRTQALGKFLITANWVGVASSLEKEPGIFLVEAYALRMSGAVLSQVAGPSWYPTVDEALEAFEQLRSDLMQV